MTAIALLNDNDKNITTRFLGVSALCFHLNQISQPSLWADLAGASTMLAPKRSAMHSAIKATMIWAAISIATKGGAFLVCGAVVACVLSASLLLQAVGIVKFFSTKRKIDERIALAVTSLGLDASECKLTHKEHLENCDALLSIGRVSCSHDNGLRIAGMGRILFDQGDSQDQPKEICDKQIARIASKWSIEDPSRVQQVVRMVSDTIQQDRLNK